MQQNFKQFIYCNETSSKNYPLGIKEINLTSSTENNIFNNFLPIYQLGLQAPPGTKVFLNESQLPVIVGFSGLLELDLSDGGSITSVRFDQSSIQHIAENDGLILIIDIVYSGGGG